MRIRCGHCKKRHDSIEGVRLCAQKSYGKDTKSPASKPKPQPSVLKRDTTPSIPKKAPEPPQKITPTPVPKKETKPPKPKGKPKPPAPKRKPKAPTPKRKKQSPTPKRKPKPQPHKTAKRRPRPAAKKKPEWRPDRHPSEYGRLTVRQPGKPERFIPGGGKCQSCGMVYLADGRCRCS